MKEVKLKIRFTRSIRDVSIWDMLDAIDHICKPSEMRIFNLNNKVEIEKISYEQNSDIIFRNPSTSLNKGEEEKA